MLPIVVKFLVLSKDLWMFMVVRYVKGFVQLTRMLLLMLVTESLGSVSCADDIEVLQMNKTKKIVMTRINLKRKCGKILSCKYSGLLNQTKKSKCLPVKMHYPAIPRYVYKLHYYLMENTPFLKDHKRRTSFWRYTQSRVILNESYETCS